MPTEFEAVGKPNIMVTLAGHDDDRTLVMNQLSNMQADEFINASEQTGYDAAALKSYSKMLDQIEREAMDNEYKRTEVYARVKKIMGANK